MKTAKVIGPCKIINKQYKFLRKMESIFYWSTLFKLGGVHVRMLLDVNGCKWMYYEQVCNTTKNNAWYHKLEWKYHKPLAILDEHGMSCKSNNAFTIALPWASTLFKKYILCQFWINGLEQSLTRMFWMYKHVTSECNIGRVRTVVQQVCENGHQPNGLSIKSNRQTKMPPKKYISIFATLKEASPAAKL